MRDGRQWEVSYAFRGYTARGIGCWMDGQGGDITSRKNQQLEKMGFRYKQEDIAKMPIRSATRQAYYLFLRKDVTESAS